MSGNGTHLAPKAHVGAFGRVALVVSVIFIGIPLSPHASYAQSLESGGEVVSQVARQVLVDPTTYAPAVISYAAMTWDWKTSQPLFEHGWLESNPRFTVSGRPNDVPVAYAEGRRTILGDALVRLGYSSLNNTAAAVAQRLLAERYPSRRKLFTTLSWAERIAFAVISTYRGSEQHIRQARQNRQVSRELGYTP